MKHATQILDELERNERRRSYRLSVIGALIVISTLLSLFLLSVGENKQVKGTVTGLYERPNYVGVKTYLLVTLENGMNVEISLPEKVPFIKNAQIAANERTTKLFGLKRYSFLSYEKYERPTRQ